MFAVPPKFDFTSFMVVPINDLEKGIRAGQYNDLHRHIRKETVSLKQLEIAPKKVYVVSFNKTIGQNEYVDCLRAFKLKPCVNGPNYLLGIMAQMSEKNYLEALYGKCLVAAEPDNPSSVFPGYNGCGCFMYVGRNNTIRGLYLVDVTGQWQSYWAFLAEEA